MSARQKAPGASDAEGLEFVIAYNDHSDEHSRNTDQRQLGDADRSARARDGSHRERDSVYRDAPLHLAREALIVTGAKMARAFDPAAIAILAALPEHFE